MTHAASIAVFIDPSSPPYLDDQLFNTSNQWLNRDGTLEPFARLKRNLEARGVAVHTADKLVEGRELAAENHYWSFGMVRDWRKLNQTPGVRLRGFVILEPPLIARSLYRLIPAMTQAFEEVYLHNTTGDGYSLRGVDRSRLRKGRFPQPSNRVGAAFANTERSDKFVAICGYHRPRPGRPEHYSTRIEVMAALAREEAADLYGGGWGTPRWSQTIWFPYLRNRSLIRSIWRGRCDDKVDTLSKYKFSVCIENMTMAGYVTEKIFDCFLAGTIPVYLGPEQHSHLLPKDALIDLRQFARPAEIVSYCRSLSPAHIKSMREAARAFIEGPEFAPYYSALDRIVSL